MTTDSPERPPDACPACHERGASGPQQNGVRYCETDECRVVTYREQR